MKIGFAKGTDMYELEKQSMLLMSLGIDTIFTDYRPIGSDNSFINKRIEELESGTILIVMYINHISHDIQELFKLIDRLNERGLKLSVVYEHFDTCSAYGRAVIEIVRGAMELTLQESIDATTPKGAAMLKMKNGINKIEKLYKKYS